MPDKVIIYTDGGARGNPGPAGIGVVFFDHKKNILHQFAEYIGKATNNQAEYRAVILALEKAKELNFTELDFYLDSELVARQINGEYKVKDKDLGSLFVKVWNLKLGFKKVVFHHVTREKNKEADKLVNRAIDRS